MPHAQLVGPFPSGVEPSEYDQLRRRVLWSMPSGLYLLSSRAGERRNLMALSLVTQLATEPKLLGVVVETGAVTHELIEAGGRFGLVVLGREQRSLVRHFVKPAAHEAEAGTLGGHAYTDSPLGALPVPEFAAAFLDCARTNQLEFGSHTLFVGEVLDTAVFDEAALAAPLRMEDTRMNYGG